MEQNPEIVNKSATEPTPPICVAGPSTSSDFRRITRSATQNKNEPVPHSSRTQPGKVNQNAKRLRKKNPLTKERVPAPQGEEISLQESVFSNHLLLREIYKHLSFKDLKSCRGVSPLCYSEATTMLLNRFETKPIKLSHKDAELWKYYSQSVPIDIEEFCSLVSKSRMFPCNSFLLNHMFFCWKNRLKFLSKHGNNIKSLAYELGGIDEVVSLVAKHLPNLETLTYSGEKRSYHVYVGGDENPNLDETLALPRLHTLRMESLQQEAAIFISKIMKVAKNLQKIYFNAKYMYETGLKDFVTANAVSKLQNIFFAFPQVNFEVYERVLNQNPRFEIITAITMGPCVFASFSSTDLPKVGEILSKLFEKCKDSLTRISSMCCLGCVPGLRIPILPKLNALVINFAELKLTNEDPIFSPAFPDDLDLEEICPNLRTLHVHYNVTRGTEMEEGAEIFPQATENLLVDTLILSANKFRIVPTAVVEQVHDALCGILIASFPIIPEDAFRFVFNLSVLTSLEITVRTGENIETFPSLDAILTGFSHETVRRLHREGIRLSNESFREAYALRVNRSLLNLEELEKLVINLEDTRTLTANESNTEGTLIAMERTEGGRDLKVGNNILFSHVAVDFAFDSCEKMCLQHVKIIWGNEKTVGNETVIVRESLGFL